MTAKEMFESLGYTRMLDEDIISYTIMLSDGEEHAIIFNTMSKTFWHSDGWSLTPSEFRAAIQQYREMGVTL